MKDNMASSYNPLTPQSRLFFSVDMVNSTAYKQHTDNWQRKFLRFYREFPEQLNSAFNKLKAEEHLRDTFTDGFQFHFWKAVGDELLYYCPVDSAKQVWCAVEIWILAQKLCEEEVSQDEEQLTKGAIFLATFPGPDTVVAIPRNPEPESMTDVISLNDKAVAELFNGRHEESNYLLDFIGPSIDTGFRVVSKSDSRYLTMSLEVAWAYSRGAKDISDRSEAYDHKIQYRGRFELKGVWNGKPYPLFAIDRRSDNELNNAFSLFEDHEIADEALQRIAIACSKDPDWPSGIYLPKENLGLICTEPEDIIHRNYQRRNPTARNDGIESLPPTPTPTSQTTYSPVKKNRDVDDWIKSLGSITVDSRTGKLRYRSSED